MRFIIIVMTLILILIFEVDVLQPNEELEALEEFEHSFGAGFLDASSPASQQELDAVVASKDRLDEEPPRKRRKLSPSPPPLPTPTPTFAPTTLLPTNNPSSTPPVSVTLCETKPKPDAIVQKRRSDSVNDRIPLHNLIQPVRLSFYLLCLPSSVFRL